MTNNIRWKQRFENFQKGLVVLEECMREHLKHPNNVMYKMALVQAFEITLELSWQTLKDYLQLNGHVDLRYGTQVIRQAFQDGLIKDGDNWMIAIEFRNKTSHVYDNVILEDVVKFAVQTFYPLIRELNLQLEKLL